MATQRQKKTAKILAESGGKKSVSAAMREAGYSNITAATPKKLTGSKSWAELMEEYLPDDDLAKVHQGLLTANTLGHMVFPVGMEDDQIKELLNSVGCTPRKVRHGDQATHVWYWAPDTAARKGALELAYKLKGRLKEKVEHTGKDGQALTQLVVIRAADQKKTEQPKQPGEGRKITL